MFIIRFLLLVAFRPLFKLTRQDLSFREIAFACVAGLRGSVSLILAQVRVQFKGLGARFTVKGLGQDGLRLRRWSARLGLAHPGAGARPKIRVLQRVGVEMAAGCIACLLKYRVAHQRAGACWTALA